MGDSPGLSGWDQHYHEGPNQGKKEAGGSVRGAVMTEAEVGQKEGFEDATLRVLQMEEGAMGPGMQGTSRSWKGQGNSFLVK